MRRSSLGFHTVDMVLRLTHEEAEKLIKHFYRHSKQPGTIRMLMLTTLPGEEKEWREYSPIHMGTRLVLPLNLKISYPDKDHGVKWMIQNSE